MTRVLGQAADWLEIYQLVARRMESGRRRLLPGARAAGVDAAA